MAQAEQSPLPPRSSKAPARIAIGTAQLLWFFGAPTGDPRPLAQRASPMQSTPRETGRCNENKASAITNAGSMQSQAIRTRTISQPRSASARPYRCAIYKAGTNMLPFAPSPRAFRHRQAGRRLPGPLRYVTRDDSDPTGTQGIQACLPN
jgi:hypothetical protein